MYRDGHCIRTELSKKRVTKNTRVLTIYMGNRKFWLENQIVCAIPFGKASEKRALFGCDAIFQLFLVCSANMDLLCSESFSLHVKFYIFTFMHKSFTPDGLCKW